MCGLTGYWSAGGGLAEDAAEIVAAMSRRLVNRGPDDQGIWLDSDAGIALAHQRLSILDRSPSGHQPMMSHCRRYVIVFNGEIYNFESIRRELELEGSAPPWRGRSDTEVMLAAIAAWGLDASLKKFIGMFAFAIWDKIDRTLSLARDRLGEKPLYYGWQGDVFLFGSELKALKAHPAFHAEIDHDALALFMRHNAIPAPYSIYRGIRKLPPGTFLQLRVDQRVVRPEAYWSVRLVAEHGQRQMFDGDDAEALYELKGLLEPAVKGQMVSDVPLGAFLSGGVDSSLVVSLMQEQSPSPVRTFTIGFHEAAYNEANHAHAVATYLGTEHTQLYVTAEQAMAVIPRIPALYDEPFADSSQIPTLLVAQLARSRVTVSLSGDGGDELFGGYNRYFWAANIWRRIGWAPYAMRAAIAGMLTMIPPSAWDSAFKRLRHFLPAGWRYAQPGDKLHKLAEVLEVRSPEEIYLGLVSHWKHPAAMVNGATEPDTVLSDPAQWADLPDFESRMMYLDQMAYLPSDILTKLDRAAMGVSLETRVPLLDHRIVEFAWSLPLSMKIRDGQGKWLLRQALYQRVPRALIERPKMGFGVPVDAWLRGPLKTWAEGLLDETRLRQGGYLNVGPVREKWREHLTGRRNWAYHLWDVLMFQAWLEAQGG